jgi:two-component system OmpR family response regulator
MPCAEVQATVSCPSCRSAGRSRGRPSTGHDALSLTREFHPRLLILDRTLPDLDGFALLRQVRQDGLYAPVLFSAVKAAAIDRAHGRTAQRDSRVGWPLAAVTGRV